VGQAPAAHHRLLIAELEAVARGETERLLVAMPPGSAKSTYASVLLPAWFLAQAPGLAVPGAAHTAALAERFSGRVQALAREHGPALGYGLAGEGRELWQTTTGGEYRAAEVGAGIAGFRADLGVIDDPIRSREEAESPTVRDKVWHWYLSDFAPRLKLGGRVVLILTRWHLDDLAGRLLAAEGSRWRVLKLPAIAGMDDPLGRAPGEPLWADDGYGYGYGASLGRVRATYEASGATRDWASLFQQEPRPAAGGLFKTAMVTALDTAPAEPAGARMVRAWDLAATGAAGTRDPDWTAGVLLMRTSDRRLAVLDVVRLRGGPEEVERAILATAERDGRGAQGRAAAGPRTGRQGAGGLPDAPAHGLDGAGAAGDRGQGDAGGAGGEPVQRRQPRGGARGLEPRLPRGAGRLSGRRARRPGGRAGAGVRRAGGAVLRHLDALGCGRRPGGGGRRDAPARGADARDALPPAEALDVRALTRCDTERPTHGDGR
jgi:hypothetical protein